MPVKYYADPITISVTFDVLIPNDRPTDYVTYVYMKSYAGGGQWIYVGHLQRSSFGAQGATTLTSTGTIKIPPFVNTGNLRLRFLVKEGSPAAKPFDLVGDDIFETDVEIQRKVDPGVTCDDHGIFGAYASGCKPSDERSTFHVNETFYVYFHGTYNNSTGVYILYCAVHKSRIYGNEPIDYIQGVREYFTVPGKGYTGGYCVYWTTDMDEDELGEYDIYGLFGSMHVHDNLVIIP